MLLHNTLNATSINMFSTSAKTLKDIDFALS
jgi:hypothetical protein